jgi:hypothetical protein
LSAKDGEPSPDGATLSFKHMNHDDLFAIVERMRGTTGLTPDAAAETAIGLKLLSEVMLREKRNPLFDPLRGGVREFILKLKGLPVAT